MNQPTGSPTQQLTRTSGVTRRGLLGMAAATAGSAGLVGGLPGRIPAAVAAATDQVGTGILGTEAVREYWFTIEAFEHNTVPNGVDLMTGMSFTPAQTTYTALGYRAWTENWGTLLPGDDQIGANTGMPGPTIRAQVGDTVKVHLRNNDTHYRFPHSLHVHGLRYEPADDGAFIFGTTRNPATSIGVGESHTYTYTAVPSSVGTWPYHSHSAAESLTSTAPVQSSGDRGEMDENYAAGVAELGTQLGLAGVIAVTGPETLPVDVENILVLIDMYKSNVPDLGQDLDLFNGAAYINNTPTFQAKVGQRVRWRIVALGKELHAFHIHGHRWFDGYRWVDAQLMGPSTSLTIEYLEDSPGDWLYHCHVTDHMMGGMVGRYHVTGNNPAPAPLPS